MIDNKIILFVPDSLKTVDCSRSMVVNNIDVYVLNKFDFIGISLINLDSCFNEACLQPLIVN